MTIAVDAPPSEDTAAPQRRRPAVTGRWLGPLLVTALAGILRLWDLGRPHAMVFDETYYAKDALSLLRFGYERAAVARADRLILRGDGSGTARVFEDNPSFVVHPPVGKWIIAGGEQLFGATPFGWRFAVAVLGTLTVLLLARAVVRMTGSALWGTVAGLLLAIDGMAIVMSRTAVLDGVLTFFVVVAFCCLLVDRDWARSGRTSGPWWRPWRLAAAVALGLACGVKWSGLYYLAGFAVMTVLWEVGRRRREGQRTLPALLADGLPTAVTMLSLAAVVYLASWTGWFLSDAAWDRTYDSGTGALAALRSLFHYHAEMWNFHTHLSTTHSYQSSAFGWLVEARPTSFYYETKGLTCPSGDCSAAVTALGNPVIWWAGTLALLHQVWRWIARRDWRSGAVLLGVAAGWMPWLLFPDRTIFTFYAVVFTPFLVAALTLSLATIAEPATARVRGHRISSAGWQARVAVVAMFLLLCIAASWFFYPIWSAEAIDHAAWGTRMWLPTWV